MSADRDPLADFLGEPRIAYFSMEIALAESIPTYAGGLGVLAGDTMRTAADLELPMVGVTLVSRAGYLRQELADGRQLDHPDRWEPQKWTHRLPAKVAVPIEGREIWIGAWLYVVRGHRGGAVPVILLDTDMAENAAEDRELTHTLYGGDERYRLQQEIVLGMGGVRMLHALGFEIRKFHLNEGHAALLTLELLRHHAHPPNEKGAGVRYDTEAVRRRCVFTTHTPVEAGHDQFPYALARRVLGEIVEHDVVRQAAGAERLNLTRLALSLSGYVNGVARRHAEVSSRMFPGARVRAITNGVHPWTWTCESFRRLYDHHLPRWHHEPELLVRADLIPDEAVREAHAEAKAALLALVRARVGVELDAERPILGFARRMTPYKRAALLFADIDRLRAIARKHPFQVVLAGKAHPHDGGGKHLIEQLHGWMAALHDSVPIVFLPGYDMGMARLLVAGSDVWLNTPQPPLEASGTSGMKAALNGVPHLSVLDGWWIEGCIEGVTGWAIGNGETGDDARDAAALHEKLEHTVLPLYHQDPAGWTAVMKGAISRCASFFNSHRMMRRYVTEAYLR